jgi:NAD(P)-dependent dehydrogenase (short-subunit alcohol dehydrogenase family)
MTSLAGKSAWITGAGSGIGEAAAISLAEAGATVIAPAKKPRAMDALGKEDKWRQRHSIPPWSSRRN